MIRSNEARRRLAILLVLGCCTGMATADDETLLRLNLSSGDTHRFTMTFTQHMTMELGAMGNQKSENTMKLDFAFRVIDVAEDGTLTIESSYDRMSIVVHTMGNEITYDTADESRDQSSPLAMLDDMIDQTFTFKASPRGRVLEVQGFDELFREMKAGVGQEAGQANVMGLVEAGFDEQALKTMLQQGLVIFPENPVGTGDDWTTDLELSNPAMGAIDAKATYDVRGAATRRSRPCLEVGVSMIMSFTDDSPMLQQMRDSFAQQGMDADLDWELGEVSSSGMMWIDRKTGLTVDSEMDQQMQATFTLAMGTGPEAVRLDMQMDLDQTIAVELLD